MISGVTGVNSSAASFRAKQFLPDDLYAHAKFSIAMRLCRVEPVSPALHCQNLRHSCSHCMQSSIALAAWCHMLQHDLQSIAVQCQQAAQQLHEGCDTFNGQMSFDGKSRHSKSASSFKQASGGNRRMRNMYGGACCLFALQYYLHTKINVCLLCIHTRCSEQVSCAQGISKQPAVAYECCARHSPCCPASE